MNTWYSSTEIARRTILCQCKQHRNCMEKEWDFTLFFISVQPTRKLHKELQFCTFDSLESKIHFRVNSRPRCSSLSHVEFLGQGRISLKKCLIQQLQEVLFGMECRLITTPPVVKRGPNLPHSEYASRSLWTSILSESDSFAGLKVHVPSHLSGA